MIDQFLDRTRTDDYACGNFAEEVWQALTGESIEGVLTGDLRASLAARRRFRRVEFARDRSIVFLRRTGKPPHCGVFFNDRLAHLAERGARFEPLSIVRLGFEHISCYAPKS